MAYVINSRRTVETDQPFMGTDLKDTTDLVEETKQKKIQKKAKSGLYFL